MRVLGVDPGGAVTGLVVRDGHRLLAHQLVRRRKHNRTDRRDGDYLRWVIDTLNDLAGDHVPQVIACERLVEPNPHLGLTSVRGLLDTAYVIGAVMHTWPDVRLVRPARHGGTPDLPRGPILDAAMRQAYPADLLPTADGTAYTDLARHCRSAWDVAGACQSLQQRFGLEA